MYNEKMNERIPLYLINGALGAGKTSVLRFLLGTEEFAGARVIENEFASLGVDDSHLLEKTKEIALIAGDCVCCGAADELLDALWAYARTGDTPVIIEATGVAHTLKLLEKLVVNDIFDQYNLAAAVFVTEAGRQLDAQGQQEAEAADLVLISKGDLVGREELAEFEADLRALGASNIALAEFGRFDIGLLNAQSHLIDYFTEFDGEVAINDSPTWSVIDTAELGLTPERMANLWQAVRAEYGLRRLKGVISADGNYWRVDGVYEQFDSEKLPLEELAKIVFIGERAEQLTRDKVVAILQTLDLLAT